MAKSSKAKGPKKSGKPAKKQAAKKQIAKVSTRSSSVAKRGSAKSASKPKPVAQKKAVAKTTAKPAPKKPVARKPVAAKISPKQDNSLSKSKAGPKIAKSIVSKVAASNVAQPKNKNLIMPTESKNNQKEVAPGGGVVLPATKSAPAMNLRADDAAILASAKERYGRKDLEAFKALLIEQMVEAKEEFEILSQNILDTSGEFEADNQNYAMHTAEQGTDAIEREKTFLHAQRTSDYIKKLEEALERIDRGIYGICVVCGLLIEKGRLQAVPITQKHVDCKNRTQTKKPSGSSGFRDHEEQPPGNVE